MESVEELAKKAIILNPQERIRLVEAILHSLDKPDPEIEKKWVAESEAFHEQTEEEDGHKTRPYNRE